MHFIVTKSLLQPIMPCSPSSPCLPQDQYAFIHDVLCDYLTCGDTSIPAHQLRGEIGDMEKVDKDSKISEFGRQFKVGGRNGVFEN